MKAVTSACSLAMTSPFDAPTGRPSSVMLAWQFRSGIERGSMACLGGSGLLMGHDGGVRKWRWRGPATAAGVVVAAGFGVAGQWRGGLAGVGVIAVGNYVAPELSGWLRDRRQRTDVLLRADRAGRDLLDRVSSPAAVPPASQGNSGAAWWLQPDQRVVGFVNRPELARLRQWCADARASGVVLATGAGGVGKTRLALRLAEEQQEAGWLCHMVRPGGEADVVGATLAVSPGHVLLIVDYAETRSGLAELLRAVARDGGERLRVLLLARGAGEWWAQLEASTDADVRRLAAAAGPVPVGTVVSDAASSAD